MIDETGSNLDDEPIDPDETEEAESDKDRVERLKFRKEGLARGHGRTTEERERQWGDRGRLTSIDRPSSVEDRVVSLEMQRAVPLDDIARTVILAQPKASQSKKSPTVTISLDDAGVAPEPTLVLSEKEEARVAEWVHSIFQLQLGNPTGKPARAKDFNGDRLRETIFAKYLSEILEKHPGTKLHLATETQRKSKNRIHMVLDLPYPSVPGGRFYMGIVIECETKDNTSQVAHGEEATYRVHGIEGLPDTANRSVIVKKITLNRAQWDAARVMPHLDGMKKYGKNAHFDLKNDPLTAALKKTIEERS